MDIDADVHENSPSNNVILEMDAKADEDTSDPEDTNDTEEYKESDILSVAQNEVGSSENEVVQEPPSVNTNAISSVKSINGLYKEEMDASKDTSDTEDTNDTDDTSDTEEYKESDTLPVAQNEVQESPSENTSNAISSVKSINGLYKEEMDASKDTSNTEDTNDTDDTNDTEEYKESDTLPVAQNEVDKSSENALKALSSVKVIKEQMGAKTGEDTSKLNEMPHQLLQQNENSAGVIPTTLSGTILSIASNFRTTEIRNDTNYRSTDTPVIVAMRAQIATNKSPLKSNTSFSSSSASFEPNNLENSIYPLNPSNTFKPVAVNEPKVSSPPSNTFKPVAEVELNVSSSPPPNTHKQNQDDASVLNDNSDIVYYNDNDGGIDTVLESIKQEEVIQQQQLLQIQREQPIYKDLKRLINYFQPNRIGDDYQGTIASLLEGAIQTLTTTAIYIGCETIQYLNEISQEISQLKKHKSYNEDPVIYNGKFSDVLHCYLQDVIRTTIVERYNAELKPLIDQQLREYGVGANYFFSFPCYQPSNPMSLFVGMTNWFNNLSFSINRHGVKDDYFQLLFNLNTSLSVISDRIDDLEFFSSLIIKYPLSPTFDFT